MTGIPRRLPAANRTGPGVDFDSGSLQHPLGGLSGARKEQRCKTSGKQQDSGQFRSLLGTLVRGSGSLRLRRTVEFREG